MSQNRGQIIGWQGIKLRVYDDWAVVGFGGDQHLGSMRIDAGDEGEKLYGLEVRWSVGKGRQTQATLESRIKPLLRGGDKNGRKQDEKSNAVVKAFQDKVFPERDVSIDFRWSFDRAGHGRIFHCEKCGRIVVAQVYGKPGGEFLRSSRLILDSVECHPAGGEYTTWGLYGLLVDVPSDFELVHQQLMNVYLQLKFQRRKSTDQLMVEQWSLANVQLRGAYLDEWYDQKSTGWTDGVDSEKSVAEVNGHPALAIVGRRSGFPDMITETIRQYSKFKKPALNYSGILWECPESNKAYMIQAFTRNTEEDLVSNCCRNTVCHVNDYVNSV